MVAGNHLNTFNRRLNQGLNSAIISSDLKVAIPISKIITLNNLRDDLVTGNSYRTDLNMMART